MLQVLRALSTEREEISWFPEILCQRESLWTLTCSNEHKKKILNENNKMTPNSTFIANIARLFVRFWNFE